MKKGFMLGSLTPIVEELKVSKTGLLCAALRTEIERLVYIHKSMFLSDPNKRDLGLCVKRLESIVNALEPAP